MGAKGYNAIENLRKRAWHKRGGQNKHRNRFERTPGTLPVLVDAYLQWMHDRNYSPETVAGRRYELNDFLRWCKVNHIRLPSQTTRPVLEEYQSYLARFRKSDGRSLSAKTQHARIGSIQQLFRWMCRQYILDANPAADLERPRMERRLPQEALSINEVKRLMRVPDVSDPLGVRDRAVLETFYSTGIRRSELARLHIEDINHERRTLRVQLGKGKRDRLVPIGRRALKWIQRYLDEVRPRLIIDEAQVALFVTGYGGPFSPDVLSHRISKMMKAAGIKRPASCHILRHSCATHMLEGGADIRYIQQLLGHAKLETTAIYTQVSIQQLQLVHAQTHPAERREAPRPFGTAESRRHGRI